MCVRAAVKVWVEWQQLIFTSRALALILSQAYNLSQLPVGLCWLVSLTSNQDEFWSFIGHFHNTTRSAWIFSARWLKRKLSNQCDGWNKLKKCSVFLQRGIDFCISHKHTAVVRRIILTELSALFPTACHSKHCTLSIKDSVLLLIYMQKIQKESVTKSCSALTVFPQ